jgi:hypothetical protein
VSVTASPRVSRGQPRQVEVALEQVRSGGGRVDLDGCTTGAPRRLARGRLPAGAGAAPTEHGAAAEAAPSSSVQQRSRVRASRPRPPHRRAPGAGGSFAQQPHRPFEPGQREREHALVHQLLDDG